MRKLLWFTVGFAAACGLCAYSVFSRWVLPAGLICAFLVLGTVCAMRKKNMLRSAVSIFAGCLAGLVWFGGYYFFYLRPVSVLDGQMMQLTVIASDFGYETDYGTAAEGYARIAGRPYRVRLYSQEENPISPGDRIQGRFGLRLTMPEEISDSMSLQGKGIFLKAYQKEQLQVSTGEEYPRWAFPAVLRRKIQTDLSSLFPVEEASFARALLLGDTRDLSYETDTAFKAAGIRHIVAVSGLHISVLYSMIGIITLRRRFLTAAVAVPVLLLFAAVAGFTPSAVRACIMVLLMLLAAVFDREYDPPTALSFAVLILLLINPLAVTSVSLQFSVACVIGILSFNGPIHGWLKKRIPGKKGIRARLRSMLCSGISAALSAMIAVTPLSAAYFGSVSLISPVTNLLTLWAVNLIFLGLAVLCAVNLLLPGAAHCLAFILTFLIRYVTAAAKTAAAFPVASVYTKSVYIVFWLFFLYVLLAVFALMKKKRPGVLICCSILGLCAALLCSWVEPLTADTCITMLDVGQGQAILLQNGGKTFLVDCGGDSDRKTADTVAHTLLSQGISRLDGIVITHYDRDHAGALQNILTRIDADCIFLPDTVHESRMPDFAGQTVYVWEDLELTLGTARLVIYGPVYSGQSNENSLCVLFDTEKCDILITGDRSAFGERMLMRGRELPDVDLLVAGHHGAAESTSEQLLNAVTPETVLISVAQDNIYGHPSPVLLQRLAQYGCRVYRTDRNGTITIRR